MNRKPKCIIITGRAGAGKTTLAGKLGERLWMPVISRDQIKEGYVNTCGVKHDELPPDTDALVTDFFFRIVNQYLAALSLNVKNMSQSRFQDKAYVILELCLFQEGTFLRRSFLFSPILRSLFSLKKLYC